MSYPRIRLALARALTMSVAALFASGASNEPNSQPNPYKTTAGWYHLPDGRTMGSSSAVDIDSKGHIWIAERCGKNSCEGSTVDPILEFDASGKLLKSFGSGMFI